jgi:glycosyltransferase involved in cell wall biosynthesis
MQAGAMGCPIICSAIDGNTDIVKPGETGLLFEVMNETALFDQLQKAINDPAAMKAMAGQLLQNIQTHYDQRVVQQFLLQKYQQLLAGR